MPVGEANSREEPSADEAQLNARMVSTLLAAWIVPGAGHFMLGKRQRAVIFLAIIFKLKIFQPALS